MNNNDILKSSELRKGGLNKEDFLNPSLYQHTRIPVTKAHTIIPDVYTSDEYYDIEQEKIFKNSWVIAGLASKVRNKGDLLVTRISDQSIIVTRDQNNKLNAFYNICRHRGTEMCSENKTGVRAIVCPYHNWGYKLSGECLGTPMFTESSSQEMEEFITGEMVENFDKKEFGLIPVRVEEWGFFVYINLCSDETQSNSLSEQLGGMKDKLKNYRLSEWEVIAEKTYDISANWKLLLENGIECYHLPWVHPDLAKTSRVEDHHRMQGLGLYSGMKTYPVTPDESTSWHKLKPVPGVSKEEEKSAYHFITIPNVMYFILANHAFVIRTDPQAPDRTVEQAWLLSHPDSYSGIDKVVTDELLGFWDMINREDIEIVEKVQRGVSNRGYKAGRFCYHFEEPVHRFQNMVIDKILGMNRIPPGDEAFSKKGTGMLDFSKNDFGIS